LKASCSIAAAISITAGFKALTDAAREAGLNKNELAAQQEAAAAAEAEAQAAPAEEKPKKKKTKKQ
jgi:hypothetical protein